MTKKIKLFCILDGDSSPFEVELEADKSIAALKKAIRDEKPNDLQGIDADKLILYQVTVPDEGTQVNLDKIDSTTPLIKATARISKIFRRSLLPKETIHVIVERPTG
ncbi:hypothetical protein BGZ76_006532, partial [Entomortierella beljakovae]